MSVAGQNPGRAGGWWSPNIASSRQRANGNRRACGPGADYEDILTGDYVSVPGDNDGCNGHCGDHDWENAHKPPHSGSGDKKPKPPAKKPQEDKPAQHQEKKKEPDFVALAVKIAKAFPSTLLGLLPGFICQPCAVLGMIAGTLAGVLFLIAGKIGDAIKAFGGALLGMVLGEAGKLLSSKLLVKKFGGQFFDVAYSIRNKVHRYRFVPSAMRAKIDGAIDTITAGVGMLYNALVPPTD